MKIIEQLNEVKTRNNTVSDILYDLAHLHSLTPQVFASNQNKDTEQHKDLCASIKHLCDAVEGNMKVLKDLIPTFPEQSVNNPNLKTVE